MTFLIAWLTYHASEIALIGAIATSANAVLQLGLTTQTVVEKVIDEEKK